MDKIDQAVSNNLSNLSEGAQLALVTCAQAYPFGCNWGYLKPSDKDLKGTVEALRAEAPRVQFNRLSNAYLVECDPVFLANSVNSIIPNVASTPFQQMALNRKRSEAEKFSNYLKRFMSGKDATATRQNGAMTTTVGLYCINEVNKIRLNGHDYNAYKLNLQEVVYVINQLSTDPKYTAFCRSVAFLGTDPTSKQSVWIPLSDINNQTVIAIYRAMELSDSNTGIFLKMGISQRK